MTDRKISMWGCDTSVSWQDKGGWWNNRQYPLFHLDGNILGITLASNAALRAADIVLMMAPDKREYRVTITVDHGDEVTMWTVRRSATGRDSVHPWSLCACTHSPTCPEHRGNPAACHDPMDHYEGAPS